MTRSLAFKLVLAFLLVSVAGAALSALFARWATQREFEQLLLEQAQGDFLISATAYYQANGSWQGVREYFRVGAVAGAPQRSGQQPSSAPPRPAVGDRSVQQPPYVFALVDAAGIVVMPAGPYRLGDHVLADELASGVGVVVDGQVVGRALVTGESPPLATQEARYLARTNRASLFAALAAVVIALILGVFLARSLTRPVRELTAATQAMAQGKLDQQVPVRSQDELGELAASFNRMSADLARSNELRRQMTADIAHDLRTPLTVMAGYLEALRDGVLQPGPERFETMHHEALHLRRLVEDLRTLSLADADELTLNCEPVPPALVLEQAAAAYQHQAEQQGIDLRVQIDSQLPRINIDPDRIAQVLGNLVSNALRYTPTGGQISLGATQQGSHVLLTVQDTGVGMHPDELPHVFERFYRGDEARQGDGGESGLGLPIAKSIVELHRGTISVRSMPGQGTTFTIILPVGSDGQGNGT
jgi:two-component system sensor histidine kinase BaeS